MCYVNDVIIATPTVDDHGRKLHDVLRKLCLAGLKFKPSKCEILKDKVVYLGRLINQDGVQSDPDSVKAVLKWEVPHNKREVSGFLGLANYYREFIMGYTIKVAPYNTWFALKVHGSDGGMSQSL